MSITTLESHEDSSRPPELPLAVADLIPLDPRADPPGLGRSSATSSPPPRPAQAPEETVPSAADTAPPAWPTLRSLVAPAPRLDLLAVLALVIAFGALVLLGWALQRELIAQRMEQAAIAGRVAAVETAAPAGALAWLRQDLADFDRRLREISARLEAIASTRTTTDETTARQDMEELRSAHAALTARVAALETALPPKQVDPPKTSRPVPRRKGQ